MENDLAQSQQQTIDEGVGPQFHRLYKIQFKGTKSVRQQLMQKLLTDINSFSPQLLARWELQESEQENERRPLRVGDNIKIWISGPWNGPVRVAEVSDTSLKLVTLEGHLEAGEIEFRFEQQQDDAILFKIESQAKSKDLLVDLTYDKIPISRFAQTEMWKYFCESVAEEAIRIQNPGMEGKVQLTDEKVEILTEKCDEQTGECKLI